MTVVVTKFIGFHPSGASHDSIKKLNFQRPKNDKLPTVTSTTNIFKYFHHKTENHSDFFLIRL